MTAPEIVAVALVAFAAGVLAFAFDRAIRARFGADVISDEIRRDAKRATNDPSRLLR